MSAPGCTVVLRNAPTEAQLLGFRSWLSAFGAVSPEWKDGFLEIEGDAKAFGCELPDAEALVGIYLGKADEAYDTTLAPAMARSLGWRPARILNISGLNSGLYHHHFVGRVACELAERMEGLIQLGTICHLESDEPPELSEEADRRLEAFESRLHPEDRDSMAGLLRKIQESGEELKPVFRDIEDAVDRQVRITAAAFPGRFLPIASSDGARSYLVDAAYMRHWLRDPHFYLE